MWIEPEQEYTVQIGEELQTLSGIEVAQKVKLNDKLQGLLPDVLGVNLPRKGLSLWHKYRTLEKLRHGIIHFKHHDLAEQARQFEKSKVRNNLFSVLLQLHQINPPSVSRSIMMKYVPNEVSRAIYRTSGGIPRFLETRVHKS